MLAARGTAGGLLTKDQGITAFDPDMKFPYAQRWSAGLQRELPGGFVAEASYVGNRGTRLPVLRQYNNIPAQYLSTSPTRDQPTINRLSQTFPNPFFGIDPIYGNTISRGQLLRPYPQFGDVAAEEPMDIPGQSIRRARKSVSREATFPLAYTCSNCWRRFSF